LSVLELSPTGGRKKSSKARDMKIVIPGGTGQIGTLLARAFVADGH
jgi:hypothetical protein